jgi:hypothetical protein
LSDDERAIFMEEYGLTESPLEKMIRNAYELLDFRASSLLARTSAVLGQSKKAILHKKQPV